MSKQITTLAADETFRYRNLLYRVQEVNLAADRYTLTATYNRVAVGSFRWSVSYVAHLLDSGKAERNPADRCDHCGEPFREGARFGDADERCEVVISGRHLLVHVEPCGFALAASRGKIIDEILA